MSARSHRIQGDQLFQATTRNAMRVCKTPTQHRRSTETLNGIGLFNLVFYLRSFNKTNVWQMEGGILCV